VYSVVGDGGCNARRFGSGGGGIESESAMMQESIEKSVSLDDCCILFETVCDSKTLRTWPLEN
jgi:hypothetical protein